MNIEAENSDFDTEKFISEVESRPALWDLNDDEYSSRDLKRKNWDELVTIFLKKEVSPAEKNEFGKLLQRKWKSLRDCYSRERQRLAKLKSGSAVSRKTQYVFYNHLSFLQNVIKSKGSSNNLEEPTAEEKPSETEQPSACSSVPNVEEKGGKRKKVEQISPEVERLMNVLQAGMQSREERETLKEQDDDRLFLLSLLKPMKKIPEHLRLGVRIQIMQVIDNAARRDVSHVLSRYQQHQYPLECRLNSLQHMNQPSTHSRESGTSRGMSPQDSSESEIENIFQE
ncbi:uncharacterized protein LOC143027943 [Oratosquilla oratoria]|uniref:uncharacterized protein LOC143027943 n=1 Tax=Oratosquilla oratoria TaxID=337810 RepID=UPI003F7631D0